MASIKKRRKSNKDSYIEGWKACVRAMRSQLNVILTMHDELETDKTVSVDEFVERGGE